MNPARCENRMGSQEVGHLRKHGDDLQDHYVRCSAGALVRNGKVLLVKRSPEALFYPDVWDLFGGHIEGKESSEEALRREALEELGIHIESFRLLGTVHDPMEQAEIVVFAISEWRGEPTNAAPNEHSEIGWFEAGRLPASTALEGYGELVVQGIATNFDDSSGVRGGESLGQRSEKK